MCRYVMKKNAEYDDLQLFIDSNVLNCFEMVVDYHSGYLCLRLPKHQMIEGLAPLDVTKLDDQKDLQALVLNMLAFMNPLYFSILKKKGSFQFPESKNDLSPDCIIRIPGKANCPKKNYNGLSLMFMPQPPHHHHTTASSNKSNFPLRITA